MIHMGDDVGRSQGGNNNAWCQNSPLGWMIWNHEDCDNELKEFVKQLIKVRMHLLDFCSPQETPKTQQFFNDTNENIWIQWHGVKTNKPDWSSWSHTISYSVNLREEGSIAWIGMNAYSQSMNFELPKPISKWIKVIDTTALTKKDLRKKELINQKQISLESRSLVLLATKKYSNV